MKRTEFDCEKEKLILDVIGNDKKYLKAEASKFQNSACLRNVCY